MKRALLSVLAVVLLLGGWGTALAQDSPAGKPQALATISVSGYDEWLADIEFIGKLGGNPGMAQGLEGMLQMMTQGKGAAGLDKTKPWGAVIQANGMDFPMYAFIPVTDLDQLIGLVMGLRGAEPPEKPADGVYVLELDGPPLFVTEKGGWAFVSTARATLGNVPNDPSTLLGDLPEKYDVALRASVKNVPPMFKDLAKAQIQLGMQTGMQRAPDESDEQYALRTKATKRMIDQILALVDDLDELLVGWTVDREAGNSFLELEITAVEGSNTAKEFALIAGATTDFAGFDLPGAAMTANLSGTMAENDVVQAKQALAQTRATALNEIQNQGLSEDETELATSLLSDMLDVLEKTIDSRKVDGGAVVMLEPGAATLVAGGAIAGGDKLEKVLKQLAEMVTAEQPGLAEALKLDAQTHKGVRFHTFSMPTPDPKAAKAVGDTLELVVGINETTFYVAAGSKATATLKKVIDQSKANAGKKVTPMRIAVAATPIANFALSILEDDDPAKGMAQMVAGVLKEAKGQDKLTITMDAIANGARTRIELEKGLLQLIGSVGQMGGQMMGQSPVPMEQPVENDSPF